VAQLAIASLLSGGAYALIGVCVVLLYRMLGVLNFAQAVIGAHGAYAGIVLYGLVGSYPLAALAAALVGALAGLAAGAVLTHWFAEAGQQARASVTIALFIALLAIGFRLFGSSPRVVPLLLPELGLRLGGVVLPAATLAIITGAISLAVGMELVLRRTRLGLRLRAIAERPTSAELLGVPVRRLALGVWALTGAITALAVLLIAPTRASDFLSLSLLILPSLAAALVGLFRNTAATVAGGLGIGLLEGVASSFPAISFFRELIPLAVIMAVLLWSQRAEVWDAAR
jgi:branched-chain amino acid transport system permease protein